MYVCVCVCVCACASEMSLSECVFLWLDFHMLGMSQDHFRVNTVSRHSKSHLHMQPLIISCWDQSM